MERLISTRKIMAKSHWLRPCIIVGRNLVTDIIRTHFIIAINDFDGKKDMFNVVKVKVQSGYDSNNKGKDINDIVMDLTAGSCADFVGMTKGKNGSFLLTFYMERR